MRVLFLMNRCAWNCRYLSLTPRFSRGCPILMFSLPLQRFSPGGAKPLRRLRLCHCDHHLAEARVNNIDHSDAADSFFAGCLAGADRVATARRAAFLRRKYATRRLRLIRTRSCCPMGSLWIENRRNAIGIATDRAFSSCGLLGSKTKTRGRLLIFGGSRPYEESQPSPLLAKKRRPLRVSHSFLGRRTDN